MKYLVVILGNRRFKIPAHIIADSRANYYAEVDSKGDKKLYDASYQTEYQHGMSSDCELFAWAHNNMNWSDVENDAIEIPIENKEVDLELAWIEADMDVIDMED